MVANNDIQRFVTQVVRQFHPEKIILFGSHAYGHPTPESDVDLLIIMRHRGPGTKVATKIRIACPRSFPMDLLVRTPVEIRRRLDRGDQFIREITTRGIVLHEADNARMG